MSGAIKSIGKAVGGAVSGVFKAVGSIASGIVKAVGSVVDMVLSPFMGLFGAPDVPDQSQSIKGVLVQQVGSNVRVPVVYGYRQVAGNVVFCETGASNNKYLWVAYVFAEGPAEGIQELFINDIQLSNAVVSQLNQGGVVSVNDGSKFAGRTTLQFYKGAYYPNPASTGIGAGVKADIFAESPSFTNQMHFNGLVTLFARYEWKEAATQAEADNNPFSGSLPQVRISLQGRKVASLTNSGFDSNNKPTGTNGAEGYTYGGSGYTEAYSMNPAEILLDYLRNPRYGKGLSNSEIDWDSFYTAAYKCRQTVNYVAGKTTSGPALTMHYVLDTGSTIFNNVKLLLQNFRGYLPYNRGRYSLRIEDAGNPTDITSGSATISKTFTKDNIFGDISYTGIDKSAKYTQVLVKYVDPDNKWSEQSIAYPPTEAERLAYVADDGGRENKGEFTFAGITNYSIAYNMARIIFLKSRFQDSISFTAGSEAFDLEPGDNIYVDANILKFGTSGAEAIPWRIVTIQLNNDYTYNINCVRNPDSIYPHTRVGELDYNIGVFIPDGANRIYPKEPTGVPVGLNPPMAGALPAPPLFIGKLNDAVTINQSTYVVEDGLTYAILEYYQPDTPQYYQTSFWFKVASAAVTVWSRVDASERVEAGTLLRKRIGPLLNNTNYEVRTRVQYINGEYSANLNRATIRPVANGTEDPQDFTQTSYNGWEITTTPPPNSRNTRVATLTAQTLLSGGNPLPLKKIRITGQEYYQDTLNQNIIGMKVFYKQSSATYWQERLYRFPSTYNANLGAFTFDIDDIGISSYPSNPGDEQYWDFILKFAYEDGTSSTVEVRANNIATEKNAAGSYNFNPFAAPASVNFAASNIGRVILTEDMAPPGAVVNIKDLTVGLRDITAGAIGSTSLDMRVQAVLPHLSNRPDFYGMRVYYRPVVQGTNPSYTVRDIFPLVPTSTGGDYADFYVRNLIQGQKYEFVFVPVVNDAGTKTEANLCWFAVGTPALGNISLLQPMGWQLVATAEAKRSLLSTFPITDPVPQVISWSRNHTSTVWGTYGRPIEYYYQLRVQVPTTGFQELQIYRRSRIDGSFAPASYAKYWGTGRWEKVVVTTSTHTFDSNGFATINLRAPVNYTEFSPFFGILGGVTLVSPDWADSASTFLKPLDTEQYAQAHEFFLVLKVSGVTSVVGALLPRYRNLNYDGSRPAIEDITGGQLPPKVLVSDFNTYDVGYNRNLTDARSSLAKNQICITDVRSTSQLYSTYGPTTTPGVV